VKKALKSKPKWKPPKGYVYCATTKPGTLFETEIGIKGIHIESSGGRSIVIVTDCPFANTEEDKRYYLGKQNWAPQTIVRRI
tara:strand:- start:150 stop:395 length:246 start_codon:yes stop_codon:yes gene_type:complete